MAQIIEIKIQNKIAKTDFNDVVSFNNVYRLKFDFDEEWAEYPNRVAVVYWEGGAAEVLFTETECDMPQINSHFSENVHVGVYSIRNGKRIASSLVPIRCLPGAYKAPPAKKVDSLHEQVLDLLNKFGDPHKFVTVDTNQTVTGQKTFTENLMVGGLEGGVELNPALGAVVRYSENTGKPIKLPDKMGTFALTDDIPDLSDLKKQSGSALQPEDITIYAEDGIPEEEIEYPLQKGSKLRFHGFDTELLSENHLLIEGTRLKAEGYTTFQSGDISLIGGQNIRIAQEGNKITFVGADIPDISGLAEKTEVQAVESAAQKAQETADSANTAAQKAQETADSAKTAAKNAQSTADSANTAAQKAQETADSANSAAQKAQSAADSANTAAQKAQSAASSAFHPDDITILDEQTRFSPKKGAKILLHGFDVSTEGENALSISGTTLKAYGSSEEYIGGDITLKGDDTIMISQVGSEFVFSAYLPENHVTTDTEQTITSRKIFSEPLAVGDYDTNAIVIDSTGIQVCSDGTCSYLTLPKKFDTVATLGDIPTNHVTTDTEQEISGAKTFTGLGGLKVKDEALGNTTQITPNMITVGFGNKEASREEPVKYLVISPFEISLNEDMGGESGDSVSLSYPKKSGTLALMEDIPDISGLAEKTQVQEVKTAAQTAQTAADSAKTAAQKAQSAAEKAQETADSAKTAAQNAQNSATASLQPEDVEISLSNSNVNSFNTALGKGTTLEFNGFDFDHAESASRKTINIQGTRVKANGSSSGFISGDITFKGNGITIAQAGKEITFGAVAPTWSQIGGIPDWIGSSKPSYTWSEIGSKPSWIGSSKPSYTWSEIGSKPTNFVTTDTEQEITASKTFSNQIIIGSETSKYVKIMSDHLGVSGTNQEYIVRFPSDGGTLALTKNIPALPSWVGSSKPSYSWSEIGSKPTDAAFGLKAYPVGAYYISNSSTSPASLFGGSWTSVTGRFLYCNAGTGTGGSNTHTLTVNEMPSHAHQIYFDNSPGAYSDYNWSFPITQGLHGYSPTGDAGKHGMMTTGGGAAHNNMPAYQTVYAWRRTA